MNKSKILRWSIKFLITIGLFVLIFRPELFGISKQFVNVELSEVWEQVKGLRFGIFVPWILAAFLIKATGMLASVRRWDLLLRGQGIVAPFRHLLGTFLVGRFFGVFLPSTVGLDAYRMYDLSRHSKLVAPNVAVFLVEKIIGLFSLSLLLFATAPFGVAFVGKEAVYGLLLLFAVPVTLSFLVLLFPGAVVWFLDRSFLRIEILDRRLRTAVEAVAIYRHARPLLMRAVGYGVIVHAATAFMYFATARAIASDVSLAEILFVAPIMIAAVVGAPVSMSGGGIREGTFIYLLKLVGIPSAPAFLLSHLGFWAGESLSMIGGVIYMLRPAGYQPQLAGKAIEERIQQEEQQLEESVPTGIWQAPKTPPGIALWDAALLSLLAGLAVGIWESLLIIGAYADVEWGVVSFAFLTYGLGGICAGLGVALVLLVFGKWEKTFHECLPTLSAASVFAMFTLVIARFRIRRDLFSEHGMGKLGLLSDAALLACAGFFVLIAGIALGKTWWKPGSIKHRRIAYGCLCFCIVLGLVSAATTPSDPREEVSDALAESKPVLTKNDAPHILLMVADALRADALGCYGADGNPTPSIDALAFESIRFAKTLAQSSWTRPSFATIFSSRYPSGHTAKYKFSALPDDVTTLAEGLQRAGYQTLGIANNTNIAPAFNYQQGFDRYIYLAPDPFFGASSSASRLISYQVLRQMTAKFGPAVPDINYFYRNAAFVNETALKAIEELDPNRPAFIFIHFMEPHDPYVPHPNDGTGVARARTPKPNPSQLEALKKLYDGEVRYMDQNIGELLDALRFSGFGSNLVTVFTADHGEEFYEHGGWWHGTTLYEEVISVPLIIRLPGGSRSGETVDGLARLLDIAPTLITAAGIDVPEDMLGRNLLAPDLEPLSYVFSEEDHEGNVLFALRGRQWKLIEANSRNPRGLDPREMYDLDLDPREEENLALDESLTPIAESLQRALDTAKEAAAKDAVMGASTTLDSELEEQMGALGYT